uniref:Uncharacterized protein n=1 Tax=uncultured SAR11 cluster alpha proteobacterium H17925_45G17 TaxID=715038 RepID=E7CA32_9PROT|nr:hypothetical protein [uncultured SAR11 cluster alpha proteobacterium H17925_45G17]
MEPASKIFYDGTVCEIFEAQGSALVKFKDGDQYWMRWWQLVLGHRADEFNNKAILLVASPLTL